ncbi:MAG: transcription termination/antitermination protein NusG [Anaerolineae bacterium]|nr:transcription termination/antitermination protein NusG [Anaerolineae bacterium]
MHEEIEVGSDLIEAQSKAEETVETLEAAPDLVEEQVSDAAETAKDLSAEVEEPQEIEALESVDEEAPEAGDAEAFEEDEIVEELELSDTAKVLVEAEEAAAEAAAEIEDESELIEAEIPADGRAWYVIHCYSGYEAKVRHNLEQRIETMQMQDQIFQVVVPTEDEIEVRDGKRRVVERRVFPGYILVQMLLNDDSWYVVRNTPGVTGFVGMGNEPTPLRPEEVQGIMKRMEAEAPKIKVTFRQGQKVRIIDGPFIEFIGVVDEIDMERAKVRVLVSFFGRETPVELDFLQVEKT